ncbi:DUF1642 domain-containing protein [Enterococcus durans]|uniref:DUF1642 domain-containing protein n=1 Tax=Enterococcus durans TaxID=53345 RepID=UPI000E5CDF8F|nr:DUF1642 domain-containing protein [Enterococcus durans]RGW67479.1 DUF1642 domain-containing protein [Enterococcus durans]
MNKKVLIDKQALIDELMKIPGVGSNSDALETIKRFPSYEPQKPVVPKFVAEWIEYAKKKGDSLAISFKPWNLYGVEYSKADRWIEDNQETFARAWIDGYEVEKEPVYYVETKTGYFVKFLSSKFNCAWSMHKDIATEFTDKTKADAVTLLVDGDVVEG